MRTGSERGFTLVEVMIAVLLTVIAVIGIISLFMTQTRASSFSRHSTEATTLATDKLEALRTVDPTTLPAAGATASSNDATTLTAQGTSTGLYQRAWTLTTPAAGGYSDIIVRVGWDEDEAVGSTCAAHSACASGMCLPLTSKCAGRAVVIAGRRNGQ